MNRVVSSPVKLAAESSILLSEGNVPLLFTQKPSEPIPRLM